MAERRRRSRQEEEASEVEAAAAQNRVVQNRSTRNRPKAGPARRKPTRKAPKTAVSKRAKQSRQIAGDIRSSSPAPATPTRLRATKVVRFQTDPHVLSQILDGTRRQGVEPTVPEEPTPSAEPLQPRARVPTLPPSSARVPIPQPAGFPTPQPATDEELGCTSEWHAQARQQFMQVMADQDSNSNSLNNHGQHIPTGLTDDNSMSPDTLARIDAINNSYDFKISCTLYGNKATLANMKPEGIFSRYDFDLAKIDAVLEDTVNQRLPGIMNVYDNDIRKVYVRDGRKRGVVQKWEFDIFGEDLLIQIYQSADKLMASFPSTYITLHFERRIMYQQKEYTKYLKEQEIPKTPRVVFSVRGSWPPTEPESAAKGRAGKQIAQNQAREKAMVDQGDIEATLARMWRCDQEGCFNETKMY
jgi:hypothetical protein